MLLPKIVSLISVVALLGWMIYFFLGALPLLIVKGKLEKATADAKLQVPNASETAFGCFRV